jgi:hypothetical protein
MSTDHVKDFPHYVFVGVPTRSDERGSDREIDKRNEPSGEINNVAILKPSIGWPC